MEIQTKSGTKVKLTKSGSYNDGGGLTLLPTLLDSITTNKIRLLKQLQENKLASDLARKQTRGGQAVWGGHHGKSLPGVLLPAYPISSVVHGVPVGYIGHAGVYGATMGHHRFGNSHGILAPHLIGRSRVARSIPGLTDLLAYKQAALINRVSNNLLGLSSYKKIGAPCCPDGPCCPESQAGGVSAGELGSPRHQKNR